jgi:serine/threonine-protein kinase
MPETETLAAALADRYTIERLIGEGGMATVYLARDIRHNRRVALKVLRPDLGAVVGVERFLAEIQVTANLQHPNLLPLFDSGAAGDLLFYVMPFVQGESLRVRLNREKQLPVEEAIRLATAIGGALDYAHRQGVIHRDLKPENVLLQEGQPLVADFGIALAVSNAGGTRITQTGLSLGTPHYMSPEQATGDRVIDGRTDIYSLGALAYEMLTGEPPHTGTTSQAIIARVLTERPRSIRASRPSVPDHVEAAIERALEKLPADRWPTAREFTEGLAGARSVTRSATSVTSAAPGTTAGRKALLGKPGVREAAAWTLAAAGIAFGWWATSRPEMVQPMTRSTIDLPDSTIASGSFLANMPSVALSRDGTLLAFVGAQPGRFQRQVLYVRRLDNLEARQLAGVDFASGPSFSPDNNWVAFVDRNRTLRRIPVGGGTSQALADSVSWLSWGDDGAIYFVRPSSGIWTIDRDGGTPRQIVSHDSTSEIVGFNHLDVLPGSKLALVRVRAGAAGIYSTTVDLETGQLGKLRFAGHTPRFVAPGFLIFQSEDGALSAVPFSLDKGEVTGPAVRVAEDVEGLANAGLDYSVAANGMVLARRATSVRLGPTHLVQFDQRGTGRVIRQDEQRYDQPRLSPDGRHLVVRVGAGAYNTGDLWVLELASGALTRLTSGNNSYRPTWSRDGKRIYYITGLPATSKVMAKPWDGSGTDSVVLDRTEIAEFAEGSPGGWTALRNYGQRDILIVPTDSIASAQPRPFVFGPSNETDMTFSPSGRLLAYQSDETGRQEVYLRPVPGPGPRVPVSVNGGQRPFWSRDGATLYFNAGTTIMAATITEQPSVAVIRRDSLFTANIATDALNIAVLPGGRGFVVALDPERQVAVPYGLTLITNWQSLFARVDAPTRK